MNLEALLDIDADPLDPSPLERAVAWLGNHGAMRLYAWWLDRCCRSCGLQRFEHAECLMARCQAR